MGRNATSPSLLGFILAGALVSFAATARAQTGAPIVIPQNGRAAGVLLSPAEFDVLTEKARFVNAVAAGLDDADSGRVVDHQSMVADVAARYDAQDE